MRPWTPLTVIVRPDARKELRRVPEADRVALMAKLHRYAATGEGDVVKLFKRQGFRLRHGDWRAVFVVQGGVLVIHVAHRSQVYD